MRTHIQDKIDRRKLLEREKNLLIPHLVQLVSPAVSGALVTIEHVDRDRSFRMAGPDGCDMLHVASELTKLFGCTVRVESEIRGDGCCEFCYTESYVPIFYVTDITKNWPTEELAKLAPGTRT